MFKDEYICFSSMWELSLGKCKEETHDADVSSVICTANMHVCCKFLTLAWKEQDDIPKHMSAVPM